MAMIVPLPHYDFFFEFFLKSETKMCRLLATLPPPPPPPPSKHPGVALGNGLYITVITIEKPISVDWNFHWTIYYLLYVFFLMINWTCLGHCDDFFYIFFLHRIVQL